MATELELAVSVGMLCAAVGFTVGLAIGRGRQPRWEEKGSFVHKVSIGFATLDRLDAVLLRFEVEPGSRLAGVEVDELRLPARIGRVARHPRLRCLRAERAHRAARRRPGPRGGRPRPGRPGGGAAALGEPLRPAGPLVREARTRRLRPSPRRAERPA